MSRSKSTIWLKKYWNSGVHIALGEYVSSYFQKDPAV